MVIRNQRQKVKHSGVGLKILMLDLGYFLQRAMCNNLSKRYHVRCVAAYGLVGNSFRTTCKLKCFLFLNILFK